MKNRSPLDVAHLWFPSIILGPALLLCLHCGGRTSNTISVTPTLRNGRSVVSNEPKTTDYKPSISASGLRIVYTSGKDQTVLRTRYAERSGVSSEFGTSQLVNTGSIFTAESQAKISPNGLSILISGTTSSGLGLALCGVGGTCTKLTDSLIDPDRFDFSPDSSAFYYVTGSSTGTVIVASTSAPSSNAQLGVAGRWRSVQFLPVSSGYKMVAVEVSDSSSGTQSASLYSFDTVASAATSSSNSFLTGLSTKTNFAIATLGGASGTTAANYLMLTRPIKSKSDVYFTEVGNFSWTTEAPQKKIPYTWEVVAYNLSNAASVTSVGQYALFGDRLFLASDQNTVFSLARVAGRCAGDGETFVGYGLGLSTLSGSVAGRFQYLKKPSDLTKVPLATFDPCDRSFEGVTTGTDLDLSDLVVNAGATANQYVLAWTSMVSGDPEVYAMDYNGSTYTVRMVSNNRK
jgi:hypothetical protein